MEEQKEKQDRAFAAALRDASNAFVMMGAHPRTLLHHTHRRTLIAQTIKALQNLQQEGETYDQIDQPVEELKESESQPPLVGFRKIDDAPLVYTELDEQVKTQGLSFVLDNPFEQTAKYSSSDSKVATVDEKTGLITPISNGEVTISVALSKKGEYPRVVDSVTIEVADVPSDKSPSDADTEQSEQQ